MEILLMLLINLGIATHGISVDDAQELLNKHPELEDIRIDDTGAG